MPTGPRTQHSSEWLLKEQHRHAESYRCDPAQNELQPNSKGCAKWAMVVLHSQWTTPFKQLAREVLCTRTDNSPIKSDPLLTDTANGPFQASVLHPELCSVHCQFHHILKQVNNPGVFFFLSSIKYNCSEKEHAYQLADQALGGNSLQKQEQSNDISWSNSYHLSATPLPQYSLQHTRGFQCSNS